MLHSTEAPQLQIPLIIRAGKAQLIHTRRQHVQPLLTLAAAAQLTHAGHQHIRRSHGLSVAVHTHIERLDRLGVVRHKYGLFIDLLGEEAFVFGLQVRAPLHLILERIVVLAQDLHGLRVRNAGKIAVYQRVQALQKRFVEKLVEESHLVRAGLQNIGDDAFHHCLGEVHLIRQVREGDLRLDHPELGRMARCVGILGAEGGAEGIDLAEGRGHRLALQLAGDRQVRSAAEEVLGKIHRAFFRSGRLGRVQRGNAKHLARAFAVRPGDQRRMQNRFPAKTCGCRKPPRCAHGTPR